MKQIKKLAMGLVMALGLVVGAQAAGGETIPMDKAPKQTNDLASLQHGAKLFVNYCLNCHSAAFMRYNRLKDIGLSEQQIKEWFGANPPDLTLIARAKSSHSGPGVDYLYTYLRTYYRDDTKATGWNNLAFPNVGMPHVLYELQGERRPIFEEHESHGHKTQVFTGKWEQVKPGLMSPQQYDDAMADLVNFMSWMAEPAQNTRVRVGVWVLLFLCVMVIFAWRLNAAYWKDVK
jgi:ubiquinol-cytochrome c reductase cytochrome c1 subunit